MCGPYTLLPASSSTGSEGSPLTLHSLPLGSSSLADDNRESGQGLCSGTVLPGNVRRARWHSVSPQVPVQKAPAPLPPPWKGAHPLALHPPAWGIWGVVEAPVDGRWVTAPWDMNVKEREECRPGPGRTGLVLGLLASGLPGLSRPCLPVQVEGLERILFLVLSRPKICAPNNSV